MPSGKIRFYDQPRIPAQISAVTVSASCSTDRAGKMLFCGCVAEHEVRELMDEGPDVFGFA